MTLPPRRIARRERAAALALSLLTLCVLWLLAGALHLRGARQQRLLRELALETITLVEAAAEAEAPRTFEPVPTQADGTEQESGEAPVERALLERALPEPEHPSPVAALRRRAAPTRTPLLEGDEPIVPGDRLSRSSAWRSGAGGRQRLAARGAQEGSLRSIPTAGSLPGDPLFDERTPRRTRTGTGLSRAPRRRERPAAPPALLEEEHVPLEQEDALEPDELIRWMRLRPGALPPGIQRHVDWRPDNLTSSATIEHEGQIYELFLMARLSIREIHVVLVRGHETYYLIDRSFQREGRKFRAGTARRAGSVITGVVSQERAAASEEASRFYSVFLSWWQRERLRL